MHGHMNVKNIELARGQTLSGWLMDRADKLYDRLIDFILVLQRQKLWIGFSWSAN